MEQITLTIDGRRVACDPGTSILEAAEAAGVRIPTLCHHTHLEPFGACRICLVEDEQSGRIMASCVTPAASGMTVATRSERVLRHRRNIVRLMMAEHPDSCIVCNKGNRCELRRIAADLGIGETHHHPMPNYRPLEQANPFIIRDLSKCILCGKCIRADHELVRVGAIDFTMRGFSSRPATLHNAGLEHSDCTFCGTCVSLCPTGALSVKDAPHSGTPERETASVCGFCGVGCSLLLGVAGNRVVETNPSRRRDTVNGPTLCVRGHFFNDFLDSGDRLTRPVVTGNGERAPVSWDEALKAVAVRLMDIRKESGPQSIGLFGSSKCTNEENYLFQKIARSILGTNNVDNGGTLMGRPALLGALERLNAAYPPPFSAIGKAGALLAIGTDPTHSAPVLGYYLKRAAAAQIPLIVVDPAKTGLVSHAAQWLRSVPGADLELVNLLAALLLRRNALDIPYIEKFTEGFQAYREGLDDLDPGRAAETAGVELASIENAANLLAGKRIGVLAGGGILLQQGGKATLDALLNLLLFTGSLGRDGGGLYVVSHENNLNGAWDMGAVPEALPGRQPLRDDAARRFWERAWGVRISPDSGLGIVRMVEEAERGNLKALFIMGENPLRAMPEPRRVRRALERLEFLVVLDILETQTVRMAHVALPGAAFSEKGGSFTSMEGRIQRFEAAVPPPGEARPDWEILDRLAAEMGGGKPFGSLLALQREIAVHVPMYGGLAEKGEQAWVRETAKAGAFRSDGQGDRIPFVPVEHAAPMKAAAEYPFTALFGSVRYHLGSGTRTGRSARIGGGIAGGEARVSPGDAERLCLRNGDRARVISASGSLERGIRVDPDLTPGMVFVPAAYHGNDARHLLDLAGFGEADFSGWKTCPVRIEKAEE